MTKISFFPQENITKAERLANKIGSVLHEALINVRIGRMDSNQQPINQATLVMSTATGVSWFYTPLLSGSIVPPYYDGDDKYEIRDITWTG